MSNLVLSNGPENVQNGTQMALKLLYFSKKHKNRPKNMTFFVQARIST